MFLRNFGNLANLKAYQKYYINITSGLRKLSSHNNDFSSNKVDNVLMDFKNNWPTHELNDFRNDLLIYENFITESEEQHLLEELEPYMKRLRYEFDHWDNAIQGYRETERKHWYPKNKVIINRVRDLAFKTEVIPYVHVLDLAENGMIKPHVDSVRYCGTTIAGISLLSDCVMRLVRIDEKKYQTNPTDNVQVVENTIDLENSFYANILLHRRSLYIMKDTARYNFTHEILGNEDSRFMNLPILKSRRVSIICRNEPDIVE